MPQLTPGQTRLADPILSAHARGFRQPGLVGQILFPLAPVSAYGGQVIEFGKEAFRLHNSRRAPGAATKRIDMGYAGKPYAIVPSALEAKVPRELMRDAAQVPGIDLASRAVNTVLRVLQLEQEDAAAKLARDVANYDAQHKVTLAGAALWSAATSTPSKDIQTGKDAIADSIGIEPNLVVLSRKAYNRLKVHAEIIERTKHTSIQSLTTDLLQTLWDVERVVVAGAKVASGANDVFSDVWGTDVILAYASLGAAIGANVEEPSYGYTYAIEGMPLVEEPYWDANAKSWIYPTSFDATAVISGMAAGYLIQNAGL